MLAAADIENNLALYMLIDRTITIMSLTSGLLKLAFITVCFFASALGGSTESLPAGDPRRCLLRPGERANFTFEALPGGGWDNLRNKDAGPIAVVNYTQCRFTADGLFLIPDGIYVVPIKSSSVNTVADIFVHWNEYTSLLSESINGNAGLSIKGRSISGGFSVGYRNMKLKGYKESSNTVRVQARYVRYTAKLRPDTPLDSAFQARLLKIARHHELNRTDMATYESQLLVRDFGTHIITSVDVGAVLVQEDQVLSSYVQKYSSESNQVKASAVASFLSIFKISFGVTTTVTKAMMDEYQKNRTSSIVRTYGGPIFKPYNYTANNWTSNMENDLVAIDRSGLPLYHLVTPEALPDVTESILFATSESIKVAVELYYKHNTYNGCTAKESPNFNFIANVDDGTCKAQLTNYTFGGAYQQCSEIGGFDLCSSLAQKNPRTGDYTCSPGYEAIFLKNGLRSGTNDMNKAIYNAYWCMAKEQVHQQSGFLFGGAFSSTCFNPITQDQSCPAEFYPLHLLSDLTVCVSDDYELGFEYALPFAGFYSCKSGNPLMVRKNLTQTRNTFPEGTLSLSSFMEQSGPTSWPHGCPKGYSQHLAIVEDGCEINYCIRSGAFTAPKLPPVQRPPFMPTPRQPVMSASLSMVAIVVITVAVTLVCVVLAVVIVKSSCWYWKRKSEQDGFSELTT